MIDRLLRPPTRSFFLFGPRGTGKSTWLRQWFSEAVFLDLLDTSLQLELMADPHALEALIGDRPPDSWVVLDEVQKIPALLDEVHRLLESRRWKFALCGSSARKLKRGGANLLAGRAITVAMEPFCSAELAADFDLEFSLEYGMLPIVQLDRDSAVDVLSAYIDTYLKEEIRAEGLIRKLLPFVRFLAIAGQLNGQALNAQNVAREAAVPRSSVDAYFSVLTDTLVAHFLPPYRPGLKVREAAHPKFYWVDPGIARTAGGLLRDPVESHPENAEGVRRLADFRGVDFGERRPEDFGLPGCLGHNVRIEGQDRRARLLPEEVAGDRGLLEGRDRFFNRRIDREDPLVERERRELVGLEAEPLEGVGSRAAGGRRIG